MLPSVTCPFNRHKRCMWIEPILMVSAFLAIGQGCRESGTTQGVENLRRERAAKPEGVLTVVRKLDLGTLPLNGRMELLVSAKNQTSRDVSVAGYDADKPGVQMIPESFTVESGESMPLTFEVTTAATRTPGAHEWNLDAKTTDGELAFKTTLLLIVKDDVVVRKSDADIREP